MDRAPLRWIRPRPRLRLPLVGILLVALAWTVLYTLRIKQYFVQPDELEYVRQAMQIGHGLHPVLPGDRIFTSWSQLQPILMAPAWTLLSAEGAFTAQHILNSLVMVSAAIPAYLLSQRVIGERSAAYVVAALTVTVPWLAFPATMMTEVAAYPAFLWAMLGLQHAVARPSFRADLVGLGAIALALTARPQFLVLAPALVVASVVQLVRYPSVSDWRTRGGRIRAALATHPILGVVAVLAVVALTAGALGSRQGLLGSYASASSGSLIPPGALDFSREALAYVAIAVGVLPLSLCLAWVLATLLRPLDAERHAFAVLALLVGAGLLVAVGSFSVRFTGGVNSRYVFYLAPLMFIGTLALLTERRRLTLAIGVGALVGAWLIRDAELALRGPSLVSPESAFHDVLFGRVAQLESKLSLRDFPPPRVLAALSLVALAGFVLLRRRGRERVAAVAVIGAISVWCVAETGYSVKRIVDTQKGVSAEFVNGRGWIDETLPDGATAPMLVSSFGDPNAAIAVWWDTAFWNKKVDRTLQDPRGSNYEQPFPEHFAVRRDGAVTGYENGISNSGDGWGTDTPYLIRAINDRRFGIRGMRVLAERNGVQIVEVPRPARLSWSLTGPNDTGLLPAGAGAQLAVFSTRAAHERPQRVRVSFSGLPGAERRGRLRLEGEGFDVRRVAPRGRTATAEVIVTAPPGSFALVTLTALGAPAAPSPTPPGVQIQAIETKAV